MIVPKSDLPPLPSGFFVEPVPNDQAVAWLRNKPAVAASVFNRLLPELKARAIAIAGVESASIARDVREAIARVPSGADWDKEKRKIAELLHPFLADPEEPKNKKPARRKAELLLRTHGFQSYAVGQHEVMREQQDVFPWWQYLTMGDELVRQTHSALNKLILPANSPFWLRHSPPWDWGCRCRKVPLLPEEVDEIRLREMSKPPEAKTVIEGNSLGYLEQQNKLDRGPSKIFDMTPPSEKGRAGAFLFEPDSLRLSPEQLRTRYDAATWSDWETWARMTELDGPGSRTVWDWMGGAPAATPVVPVAVAPVSPRRLDDLASSLAPLHSQRQAALGEMRSNFSARKTALSAGDVQAAQSAQDRARAASQAAADLLEAQRDVVGLPASQRGKVRFAKMAPSCKEIAEEGSALTARYTHPDLLPIVGVVYSRSNRAKHYRGDIFINARTSASVVMHEITHATEQQNADILAATLAFLKARAGSEQLQTLRKLTGQNYRANEFAYEDEFQKRGGSHYMGKTYVDRATEILTMGIERLHADPGDFAEKDPEYFRFIVSTLQKL